MRRASRVPAGQLPFHDFTDLKGRMTDRERQRALRLRFAFQTAEMARAGPGFGQIRIPSGTPTWIAGTCAIGCLPRSLRKQHWKWSSQNLNQALRYVMQAVA